MPRPLRKLIDTIGSPYGTLLLGLGLTLLLLPFTGSNSLIRWALAVLMLAVVVAALRTPAHRGIVFRLLWILGIAAVVGRVAQRIWGEGVLAPVAPALSALFYTSLILIILADIFRRRQVTVDAVLGASCAFVLMGLAWGSLYLVLETLQPGSFEVPSLPEWIQTDYGAPVAEVDLNYFSFITMTTIGFGDVVPLTPPARGLAILQGIVAQLFLAIIVARLVGLEVANRIGKPDS